MSLVSPAFAAFIVAAALVFHASTARVRPLLLCLISIVYCALNGIAAALALLLATTVAFQLARWIERATDGRQRRVMLIVGIVVLLLHLVIIKLLPYLAPSGRREWLPELLAAFGASYYTFKLLGYLDLRDALRRGDGAGGTEMNAAFWQRGGNRP